MMLNGDGEKVRMKWDFVEVCWGEIVDMEILMGD